MKQIFDWLREQIENKCNYEPVDYDYCDMACSGEQGFIAREDVLDAINEAEAKWEAVMSELEKELKLADEEKERFSRENPLQFDTAKGYENGISNAIEIVRKAGGVDGRVN